MARESKACPRGMICLNKTLTDRHLLDSLESSDLSDVSKRQYISSLTKWAAAYRTTSQPIVFIMKHPKEAVDRLKSDAIKGLKTVYVLHTYYSAVLSLFKHVRSIAADPTYDDLKREWKGIQAENWKPISEELESNQPTSRQRSGYLPLKEIVAGKERLKPGCIERILIGMYTDIPPARRDYNALKIVEDERACASAPDNCLLVRPDSMRIVLKKFKTAGRYGTVTNDVPRPLADEIRASLRENPRAYLFQSSRTEPYTKHAFGTWANRTLAKVFGRPLTLTLLRHAYVSDLDFNKPLHELKRVANSMMHSTGLQKVYQYTEEP